MAAAAAGHAARTTAPHADTYHHGNLRRAILDESLAIVAERGTEGLSLRQVAARAGVSHTAPYHHFADKTALLAELAREGMAVMAERMQHDADAAGDDARERLLAIGMAYVRFAEQRPDYYAVFQAPELAAATATPEAMSDPGPLWWLMMDAVGRAQAVSVLPPGDPVVQTVYLWSLAHGLADLWRTGTLAKMPPAALGFEAFARQVLDTGIAAAAPATAGGGGPGTVEGAGADAGSNGEGEA